MNRQAVLIDLHHIKYINIKKLNVITFFAVTLKNDFRL
ncbi:Uncharacterized protein dnm_080830 [Desulfonema magnum]|uniref:Uncharacterized protein n=1 Tax=Desulfonema magnum TaxID=45655 RepID=A0A975GSF7_9BACT|nr:Uncharacterized protein dnm_080830 [Desulfonema magnum]